MQREKNVVRTFYPTCSKLLDNALLSLGYKLVSTESYGLNEIKVYGYNKRFVEHGYKGLSIYTVGPKGEKVVRYSGKVIEKNMLESFTKTEKDD